MPSTIRPESGQHQTPVRDRVATAWGRSRGLKPEAARADIRTIEDKVERLIRHYSREGADNRIERVLVRARLAAAPTGAIDCGDEAAREILEKLHELDQRGDTARFYLGHNGMLPVEEDTALRAFYAEIALLQRAALVFEARREARRA